MFGKMGVIVCIFFIALTLAEVSRANPVIGKKKIIAIISKYLFYKLKKTNQMVCLKSWNVI